MVALVFAAFASHELTHLFRFGHFIPLGLHVEVVVTTSNALLGVEGTGKIYNASLTNYGILPAAVTVGDYLDSASRHQTMVNPYSSQLDKRKVSSEVREYFPQTIISDFQP